MESRRHLVFFIQLGVLVCCVMGCSKEERETLPAYEPKQTLSQFTPAQIQQIETFCGDCHPMPIPSTFPKANWPEEVDQGFAFYFESGRSDLVEPIRQDVVRYFQSEAPDVVFVPRADQMPVESAPIRFEPGPRVGIGEESPVTAHIVWNPESNSVVFTDMNGGAVREWYQAEAQQSLLDSDSVRLLARGKNSCRIQLCDWNSDGIQDYLLGELGTFQVGDHEEGRVSLLLGTNEGKPKQVVLADGLARVVEAKVIDFDDDGLQDVLVAEFGWRKTGALKLLRNVGGDLTNPEMRVEVLDDRHGALGIEIADLNQDGRPDFVVAYGQEFETIEAYMNQGEGVYKNELVAALPDPSYNSSAFHLADVDADGLLDIVHTCGDTMDALLPKPYHGVRVIRNLGAKGWENHELGLMIGALQAATADFDGDGDLDIAAVGLLIDDQQAGKGAYDSVCWWEQRDGFKFVRHFIERDHCRHASCAAVDVNRDGRLDLLVGEWLVETDSAAFQVFLNLEN